MHAFYACLTYQNSAIVGIDAMRELKLLNFVLTLSKENKAKMEAGPFEREQSRKQESTI